MQVSPSMVVMYSSIAPQVLDVKLFLGVYIIMEVEKIILVALGMMVSMVAFFLKKESLKVDRLSKRIQNMEIDLAKNSARDSERWTQTTKLLEDRRTDVIKIFEKLNK
jgi:hypothetical protein